MTWIALHDAIAAILRRLLDVRDAEECPAARGLDL
jgi:hypothetical protein